MKIIKNFCMWSDLLGYGAPFKECKWNLNSKEAKENLLRITLLELFFHERSHHEEISLVLNDGIIRSLDFKGEKSYYERKYLSWLSRAILNYTILNENDIKNSFYGLRSVLTIGDRYEYMNNRVAMSSNVIAHSSVMEKLKRKTAIYSPKEFQMNTAFSKAYIMEESGSGAGLKGNNLFIDIEVLNTIRDYYEDGEHRWNRTKIITDETEMLGTIIEDLVSVTYKVKEEISEKYFIWSIDMFMENEKYTLMKLWFDKDKIEYKNHGIKTDLYRLEKYNPQDEDEDYIIDVKIPLNKEKIDLSEEEIEVKLRFIEKKYKERQEMLSSFSNYVEE